MKKLTKIGIALTLGLSLVFMLNSCEKLVDDASETADSAEDFSDDQTAITGMTDLVQDVAETQGFLSKNGNSILPEGVTITYTDTLLSDGDGIEIGIDLGEGVECGDGWKRKGFFTLYSNEKKFTEVGSRVWIGTDGSTISMTKAGNAGFDTSYSITFMSADNIIIERTAAEDFSVEYSFQLEFKLGGMFVFAYTPTGDYVIKRTEGGNTPGANDDVYELSGTSTGENHNGTAYTMSITETLVRKVDKTCSKTFTQGAIELKNAGSNTSLKLNFGTGACDNDVVITLPGGIKKTYTVE